MTCRLVLLATRVLVLCGVFIALPGLAHDVGVARVDVHEEANGLFRLQVKLPRNVPTEAPRFPPRCELISPHSMPLPEQNRSDSWQVNCAGELCEGERVHLPWSREGIVVNTHLQDGKQRTLYLKAGEAGATLPLTALIAPVSPQATPLLEFVVLGVEHILLGWDHLAFVLALCLVAKGLQLLKLVTLFTLGHTATLLLATFEWVRLSPLPVEICIALSVAFVAREACRSPGTGTTHGGIIVLCFGLLHGMGFATALGETGIEGAERVLGVLMFNVGVELGQVLFVVLVLCSGWLLQQRWDLQKLRYSTAFLVGSMGVFWSLDRMAQWVI